MNTKPPDDADSEELAIGSNELFKVFENVNLGTTYVSVRTYIGENAFGVKRQIQAGDLDIYSIEATNNWPSRFSSLQGSDFRIKLPRQTAKQLRAAMKLVLVVKIIPPFVRLEEHDYKPTITNPREGRVRNHFLEVQSICAGIVDGGSNRALLTIDPPELP